ncbi:hypothetical protein CCUS01_16275 [Colletotrichum cuscutae]|uniref:Uncharacterized protein n=1 Tax=Colletotrichum cuscutae TaxID=1209917 RepID=A0AAI9Y5R5_9PEZI|nr:hypothetical protein CCUS01_16275 [Colletotrichum cuscutae]
MGVMMGFGLRNDLTALVSDKADEVRINGETEMDRRALSSIGRLGGNVGVSDQKASREDAATTRIESESGKFDDPEDRGWAGADGRRENKCGRVSKHRCAFGTESDTFGYLWEYLGSEGAWVGIRYGNMGRRPGDLSLVRLRSERDGSLGMEESAEEIRPYWRFGSDLSNRKKKSWTEDWKLREQLMLVAGRLDSWSTSALEFTDTDTSATTSDLTIVRGPEPERDGEKWARQGTHTHTHTHTHTPGIHSAQTPTNRPPFPCGMDLRSSWQGKARAAGRGCAYLKDIWAMSLRMERLYLLQLTWTGLGLPEGEQAEQGTETRTDRYGFDRFWADVFEVNGGICHFLKTFEASRFGERKYLEWLIIFSRVDTGFPSIYLIRQVPRDLQAEQRKERAGALLLDLSNSLGITGGSTKDRPADSSTRFSLFPLPHAWHLNHFHWAHTLVDPGQVKLSQMHFGIFSAPCCSCQSRLNWRLFSSLLINCDYLTSPPGGPRSSNGVIGKGLRFIRQNDEAIGNWKFEQGAACPSKLRHGMAYAITRSTYGYRYSKRQSAKFNGPCSWPQPFLNQGPRACLSSHHVLVLVPGTLQIEPAPSSASEKGILVPQYNRKISSSNQIAVTLTAPWFALAMEHLMLSGGSRIFCYCLSAYGPKEKVLPSLLTFPFPPDPIGICTRIFPEPAHSLPYFITPQNSLVICPEQLIFISLRMTSARSFSLSLSLSTPFPNRSGRCYKLQNLPYMFLDHEKFGPSWKVTQDSAAPGNAERRLLQTERKRGLGNGTSVSSDPDPRARQHFEKLVYWMKLPLDYKNKQGTVPSASSQHAMQMPTFSFFTAQQ